MRRRAVLALALFRATRRTGSPRPDWEPDPGRAQAHGIHLRFWPPRVHTPCVQTEGPDAPSSPAPRAILRGDVAGERCGHTPLHRALQRDGRLRRAVLRPRGRVHDAPDGPDPRTDRGLNGLRDALQGPGRQGQHHASKYQTSPISAKQWSQRDAFGFEAIATLSLRFAKRGPTGCRTEESERWRSTPASRKPSKPRGLTSRRCRSRTWRSSGGSTRRSTEGIATAGRGRCHPTWSCFLSRQVAINSGQRGRPRHGRVHLGVCLTRGISEDFHDAGDQIVVVLRRSARSPRSPAVIQDRFGQAISIQGGRIVRFESFGRADEALEAAGLSE